MAEVGEVGKAKKKRLVREDDEIISGSTVQQPIVMHHQQPPESMSGNEEISRRHNIIRLSNCTSSSEHKGVVAVVGVGPGLGYSIAQRFVHEGYTVAIFARNKARLERFVKEIAEKETNALLYAIRVDCSDLQEVKQAFESVRSFGFVELLVYNVLPGMVEKRRGTIIFTGSSESVQGQCGSAETACGKFALRALAQCLTREFQPQGIHVAHVIVDGLISFKSDFWHRKGGGDDKESKVSPESIAEAYWHIHMQNRGAWTHELDLRPV